jgi:D-alanyl-D-alanine carboxypeptidase
VAVVQGGKVAYVKAYGMARLEPPMPAEPGMQYSIGSISKQFTAAVVLLLAQDGKLKLDDPVRKYLPGLARANEVTIRQVLSMTSGYQDFWPEDYVMTSMMKPGNPQQILDVWAKKPLDFEPGTEWQYSNTNYVVAGGLRRSLEASR